MGDASTYIILFLVGIILGALLAGYLLGAIFQSTGMTRWRQPYYGTPDRRGGMGEILLFVIILLVAGWFAMRLLRDTADPPPRDFNLPVEQRTLEGKSQLLPPLPPGGPGKAEVRKQPPAKVQLPALFLQIGAFGERANARRAVSARNLPAKPEIRIRREGQMHKVLIGPFPDRRSIRRYRRQHAARGFVTTLSP